MAGEATSGAGPAAGGPPPGYPAEFERSVCLRDGRVVSVRPIIPGDADDLAAAIRSADAETLRRRFLGGTPAVTPKLLNRLTVVDYVTRFALVARDARTGTGVGIARYEGLGGDAAEVAVVVDPAWRRIGVATTLVRMLAEAAAERGIRTFTAYYLAENRAVQSLLAEAGSTGFVREGVAEREVVLDRAPAAETGEPMPGEPRESPTSP
jgi:RimJ/RimL family protein N-acetyltransferase